MTVLFDTLVFDQGFRKTQDGYLVATPRVARSGVQDYGGWQVDPDGTLGLRDKRIVRVYRPPEEVFHADSLKSYAYRPITNDHPSEEVTADNWRALSVGQTGGEVIRDGNWVRVPAMLMDSAMINAVESGKCQLSMGYRCTIDAVSGTTPEGEAYDAIQRGQRMNHLAVVDAARAGELANLLVDNKGGKPSITKEDNMSDATKSVVLGDHAIRVTPEDEAKITSYKADLAKLVGDMQTKHTADLARVEGERDAFKQKLEDAEKKIPDMSAMDAAVADRADLVTKAKAIDATVKTDGVSNADIRKAVVVAKFGDGMVSKDQAYIDARFDVLAEDLGTTRQVADAIQKAPANSATDAAAYEQALAKANANLNKRFAQ